MERPRTALVSSPEHPREAIIDSSPIRTAVVGVGSIGRHHARILRASPTSELVAVVDRDEAIGRSVADAHGAMYLPTVAELIELGGIGAATVAVPTEAHEAVASQLIEAGIPVLVEKPIANDVAAADRLIDLSARHGVPLAVGHIERFNPAIRLARELIRAGALGQIISLTSRRLGPVPPVRQTTDVVLDLAVHDLDLVAYLLGGRPRIVHAKGGRTARSRYEDWADITLVDDEASCFIQVSWTVPIKIRSIEITGTEGYIEISNINQTVDFFEAIDWRDAADFDDFVRRFGEPRKKRYAVEPEEPLRLELESFLASVSGGTEPEVGGEVGRDALALAVEARDRVRMNSPD